MKHLWHLLAADLRRVRLVLAVWLIVVAANRLVKGASALFAADPNLRESSAVLASVLWLAELLLIFVLVSFVIHAHPTVGTDAFWLTRPIPRRLLLAAKLLLFGIVLVLAPAIAEAVLLAAHRMPLEIGAGVVAQVASIDTVWMMLIVVAAALTPNVARFALLIGGALVAVAIAIGGTIAVLMARLSDEPPIGNEATESDPTSVVVFNAGFVLAALALLAVQYETRLRRRSVFVGAVGIAVALLIAWIWPIPFLSQRLVVPEWARDERVLTVHVDARSISTNTQHTFFPGQQRQWTTVNGRVDVDGVAPGWTAAVAALDVSVQLPGGETIRSAGGGRATFPWWNADGIEPHTTLRRLLGVTTLAAASPVPTEPPKPEHFPALFLMERAQLARYAPATGHYRARMQVRLRYYAIDGTLPLQAGAIHQHGGYRLILDSIAQMNGEVAIVVREARATSMWERRPLSFYTFYLRNRGRSEALEVSEYPLRGGFTLMRFLPFAGLSVGHDYRNGFFTRAVVLTFPPRYGSRAETLAADSAWLADADLVIVRRTEEGSVDRAVAIPAFPIGNARQVSTRQ